MRTLCTDIDRSIPYSSYRVLVLIFYITAITHYLIVVH